MRHYVSFPILSQKECKIVLKSVKKSLWSFAWQKHFTTTVRFQEYTRLVNESLQVHLQSVVLSRYNKISAVYPIHWFEPYIEIHRFKPGAWQDYHREYHPLMEGRASAKSVTIIIKLNQHHQSKVLLRTGEIALTSGEAFTIPAFDEYSITDPVVTDSYWIIFNAMRNTKNYKSN